jgi:phospholipid/cholesterol/gamma-HCH transport system permease protein
VNGEAALAVATVEAEPNVIARTGDVADTALQQLGHMLTLLGRVLYTAVREPRGYWAAARDDTYYVLKRTWLAQVAVQVGFGLLVATFAASILLFLGAANRLGTVYLTFSVRAVAPLFTGFVLSGALGSATTSEIGARKIREELDALRVLGQDPVRLLVLPRVIAIMTMMMAFVPISVLIGTGEAVLIVHILGDVSYGAFLSSFINNMTVGELVLMLSKSVVIGLLIGIISSSKGMTAEGGAEGLGRAVNQTVVVSLLMVLTVTTMFDLVLLATNPDITVSR